MRELVARFLSRSISRRTFLEGLAASGIAAGAARDILESLVPAAHAQDFTAPVHDHEHERLGDLGADIQDRKIGAALLSAVAPERQLDG